MKSELAVVVSNLSDGLRYLPSGTILGYVVEHEENTWALCLNVLNESADPDLDSDEALFSNLRLEDSNLTTSEFVRIKKLLSRYKKRFLKKGHAVTQTDLIGHTIDTGNARPTNQAPYRAGPKEREIIEIQVDQMLVDNIIRPSKSPWASPVVLVHKKDGSIRFCINYTKLNAVTKRDVYPLPRIDDTLNSLGQARYFSTFDLASGYHQIPMAEEDKEKTAFVSHLGLFEFNTLAFGLNNAPATFQRFMDQCLAGLKWKSVLIYIDDIIVFSNTFDQHLIDLEEVFIRLENFQLSLKSSKCFICRDKLEYLGHTISADGIGPSYSKVTAIQEISVPSNVKELKSFLGICSYYRKFIKNFSKLCSPLTELTKLGVEFIWNNNHLIIFESLKGMLTSAPIMAHPDIDHPFIVQKDACDFGLGAVLCQKIDDQERSISYISRTL